MDKELCEWKKKEIENIKNDIEYHKKKIKNLEMKLKVFESWGVNNGRKRKNRKDNSFNSRCN